MMSFTSSSIRCHAISEPEITTVLLPGVSHSDTFAFTSSTVSAGIKLFWKAYFSSSATSGAPFR